MVRNLGVPACFTDVCRRQVERFLFSNLVAGKSKLSWRNVRSMVVFALSEARLGQEFGD